MAEADAEDSLMADRERETVRAENLRLQQQNERLKAQAAGVAGSHSHAAEAIAELEEAQTELRKRERILDAITKVAAELLAAAELDAALPAALQRIGEAVAADRVIVLEMRVAGDGNTIRERGIWNAPGVEPQIQPGYTASRPDAMKISGAFLTSLTQGQLPIAFPRRMEGEFAAFLRSMNVQSFLLVPILVEAERWGFLAFDDCHTERVWSIAECDTLQLMAEVIGAAVARERRLTQLSEAKRIVENSSTVLFRAKAEPGLPVTYVSANVSRWGYDPQQFTGQPSFYRALIHPEDAMPATVWIEELAQDRATTTSLECRIRFADQSYHWFESRIVPIRDQGGGLEGYDGTLIDIDERKRVAEELEKRDRILGAITQIAAELMAARSPDEAIPGLLPLIGQAVDSSRVIVLQYRSSPEGIPLVTDRWIWNAPGVEPQIQPDELGRYPRAEAAGLFFATLPKGQATMLFPGRMEGELAPFLRLIHIQSVLLVPISVDADPWGYLTFDDCRTERVWTSAESDALQVLAEMIGAAVARERRVAELSDAKRIVENSSTMLFRAAAEPGLPVTYISANVSKWGYEAAQLLAAPTFYHTLVHPEDQFGLEEMEKALFHGEAVAPLEFRMRLPDGSYRWFENRVAEVRDKTGQLREFEGVLFDIQERKRAAEEVQKRDRILDAITRVAAELMAAGSPEDAVPEALHLVGEAVEADRVIVLENTSAPDGVAAVCPRYAWNAPGVEPQILPGLLESRPETAALGAYLSKLPKGQMVTFLLREMVGEIAEFLRGLHIQSSLRVPIFAEGEAWGHLGIDDCHRERSWSSAEGDTLRVLAEIIGAAIARARRVEKLAEVQRIIENSTTVLFRHKAEPRIPVIYVSANASRWGYRPEQFTATPGFHLTLIHPDDQARMAAWINELLRGSGPLSAELRVRFADGTYHWFENRIVMIRDQAGRLVEIEAALSDIDERKRAEQQLSFANAVITAALESVPGGFLVVDAAGRVLALNQRFLQMWRIPPEVAAARLDEALLKAVAQSLQDPEGFLKKIQYLYEHPEEKAHDELALRDGRMFERHSAVLYDAGHHYLGRIWFFMDITEQKKSERELARLARTDPLTGLANRATFLERLELMFAASGRGASPFAVLYVDLDNFKEVNDSLGHAAGDELLKEMALRVAANVRSTDLVARFGGDEFAVLQADAEDPSTCGALANKIRARLAEPYRVASSELRITATIGIALYSPEIGQPLALLERADRALYRGKEEGRDRYCFHSPDLDVLVHERISLSEELREAIERDELELHYQPQVDIASGGIVGVEALVRWNHPRRGQLKPADFLGTAERTGVIGPLGDWVLDRACRQLRRWRDERLAPPVMAVNLSAVQLKLGRDFDQKVSATLARWGLKPQDLEFDVAEAVLAGSSAMQPDPLERLCDLGVRIAIDDFGSDYTSIGRVKAYQVKRFKIAPQFIRGVTTDPINAGVVRMMINVARQLGIEIIAKSVETEEQRDFLRSVTETVQAQGYYYSEPLDAEHATELLRHKQMEPHRLGPVLLGR